MPKKPLNTPVIPAPHISPDAGVSVSPQAPSSKELAQLGNQVLYEPTPKQQKIKARFWNRFQPGPFSSPDTVSLAEAQQVTGVAGLKAWWDKPGFKEWFLNRDEGREKVEYLFIKALEAVELMLFDEKSQASAKVNALKVLAELANKYPNNKSTQTSGDSSIASMSEAELVKYLERKGVQITEEKVIDVAGQEESGDS